MKTVIDVEIMGQRLRVTSDEGEVHLRRVVEFLTEQIRSLSPAGGGGSGAEMAILAALNIASEYWRLKEEQEEMLRIINRLSERIVEHLGT